MAKTNKTGKVTPLVRRLMDAHKSKAATVTFTQAEAAEILKFITWEVSQWSEICTVLRMDPLSEPPVAIASATALVSQFERQNTALQELARRCMYLEAQLLLAAPERTM